MSNKPDNFKVWEEKDSDDFESNDKTSVFVVMRSRQIHTHYFQ